MLRETLRVLVESGGAALRRAGCDPSEITVRPLRSRQLMFPRLALLRVSDGTVGQVYVGADGDLAAGPSCADQPPEKTAFGLLCEDLLAALLDGMPVQQPTGAVHLLGPQSNTVITRGVRTFVVRFASDVGSLYVVGELASRGEIEAAKKSDFESSLVNANLPHDFRKRDELTAADGVPGAMHCLSELETDIQLEVATDDAEIRVYNGLLWQQTSVEERQLLKIIMFPPRDPAPPLRPGDVITGHCTVGGSTFVFETSYAGPDQIDLLTGVALPCHLFTLPERLVADQRRRNYRIEPRSVVRAELIRQPQRDDDAPSSPVTEREQVVHVDVADISFSGVRLVARLDELRSWLVPGDCVRCRFIFPEHAQGFEVSGEVRRMTTVMFEHDRWQDDVGLEFLILDDDDRCVMETIRDYVLAEQRVLLSRRVQIAQRR